MRRAWPSRDGADSPKGREDHGLQWPGLGSKNVEGA